VRPTKICLSDLALPIPPFDIPLSGLDHPLIDEAQRLPAAYAAGAVERILSLKDRVWFKVKTSRWRGASTRLSAQEQPDSSRSDEAAPLGMAPWWLGAGGYRRDGDPHDFYAALAATAERDRSSERWLPTPWDWNRFVLESAFAWERHIRLIVRELIARSLRSGDAYVAEFEKYTLTALAKARDGETYLAIGAENAAHPKVFAVILNAVPGVSPSDWMPEPGGVAGLEPRLGEIIWSTILPPAVAARLLESFSDE
jgi:hypothetical protein